MNGTVGLYKLDTAPVIKPWGLKHGEALSATGVSVGLGELWLASAQTGEGNYASDIDEPALSCDLNELLTEAAGTGEGELEPLLGQKSLQIFQENPHRGKTEAWLVREASGRAGFAAGPRTSEQCRELEELVTGPGLTPHIEDWPPEVCDLFGIIEPVQAGEVYMVPAGTLHTMFAIGEDSHLVVDEIQQGYGTSWLPTLSKILMVQNSLLSVQVHPSDETVKKVAEGEKDIDQNLEENPTVRVYDFGRRPGEYPELGFELTDVEAGLRTVEPVSVRENDRVTVRVMVAHEYFAKKQLLIEAGGSTDLGPRMRSYHVLHCISGEAVLETRNGRMRCERGETVFVPAKLENEVTVTTGDGCEMFDDCVPEISTLQQYLGDRGAESDDVEALFNPPRALGR